jgi:4-hydroxythreonine-4-phosphate dehydrogenase
VIARPFTLALTQGDPAGIGPEIVAKLLARLERFSFWRPLVIAERPALQALSAEVLDPIRDRLEYLTTLPSTKDLDVLPSDRIAVLDPVQVARVVQPGQSGAADAAGAVAAIDVALELATRTVWHSRCRCDRPDKQEIDCSASPARFSWTHRLSCG